jgi:RecA/RadA recombinase
MSRCQLGSALYSDIEHKLDDEQMYATASRRTGGADRRLVVRPPSGSDALDIMKAQLDRVDLIVIDSVPALVTKNEILATFP